MRDIDWEQPTRPTATATALASTTGGVAPAAEQGLRWRVVKKLLPGQPGTLKLLRQHGPALVCVRYRLDHSGRRRCTTVELVVEHAPVAPRPERMVGVQLNFDELQLRAKVLERGARWDRTAKLWHMPRRVAVEVAPSV